MLQKDLIDLKKAWDFIFQSLLFPGRDIQLWSKNYGYRDYFHAVARGNKIIITRSLEKDPSCKIQNGSERSIDYQQFECVANRFNQYVAGDLKRHIIRDKCGQNTSYIISLIIHFL